MLTLKAEILKTRPRKDGSYNMKIRVTEGKNVIRISTNLFAVASDFTSKLTLREDSLIKAEADRLVAHYRESYINMHLEDESLSLTEIVNRLMNKDIAEQPVDFIKFCQDWISHSKLKGVANYQTSLNALIRFNGSTHLDIKTVTSSYIERFKCFLDTEYQQRMKCLADKGKQIPSNRATSLYLMSIKHLFNEAQAYYNRPDEGLMRVVNNPFLYFKIPKQGVTRKRAITPEQIRKVYELPYQTVFKGRNHTNRFNLAKDCFILSFCMMGINSADLYNATEFDGTTFTYYRTKTKDRRADRAKMQIAVPKIALQLFEKNKDRSGQRVFNFYQDYADSKGFNKALNAGLKEIGTLIGVDDLEYYAARHSWATIALNKVGIDKYTVHSALNHVDESMRVTDIYIERDFVNENKANTKVLKYVTSVS